MIRRECAAVCCSVVQRGAVCCSVLQHIMIRRESKGWSTVLFQNKTFICVWSSLLSCLWVDGWVILKRTFLLDLSLLLDICL